MEFNKRVIRVFISSTFRDMHAEREELVKFTFPELRRRCRERQVEFVDVDLRWGITDENKAEGKVLPICLAEIERCRPYFIGLLGERYGWVPEKIEEELIKDQPWLAEHKEHSVTALEIFHGVLNNPNMKSLAFFYFRDPARSRQVEEQLSKETDYSSEPEASRIKLGSVKERIRQSGYPVRENYADARTCGQLVLEDLWEVIDKRFPKEEIPSALEHERMEHEAFAAGRRKVYIGKEEYFNKLDEHVAGDGQPLVLLGESGSGKSALIANWAKRYRENNPEDFMVLHFIGSTPDSADYTRIIRRIMEEIRERYEPEKKGTPKELSMAGAREGEEIPTDPLKLIEQFPYWLAKTSGRGRFILILDALNQLEDRDNAPDLGWLPECFPPNIRVILSTLLGRSLNALQKRGWPVFKVEPLTPDERKKFIPEYLKQYTKELSSSIVEQIALANQTSNPLYLRALLEELRIYGDYHTLTQRIDYYLAAEKVEDLYEKVLDRWELDFERDRKGLVREVMSLIWASRKGLSETELLEILGSDGKPLQKAHWSPLYLAAEESLISRSGLLNFFHDFLRKAVEDRYLYNNVLRKISHLSLANYFAKKEINERKVDELPWQLKEAEEWEKLKNCISNLKLFDIIFDKHYELIGYWLVLREYYDPVTEYQNSLIEYQRSGSPDIQLGFRLIKVGIFLGMIAKYEVSEGLFDQALSIFEKSLELEPLETCITQYVLGIINCLAFNHSIKGEYEQALIFHQRSLQIAEKYLGLEHPDTAHVLVRLSEAYLDMDIFHQALSLCKRALQIWGKLIGHESQETAHVLDTLGEIYYRMGSYGRSLAVRQRALQLSERVVGTDHLYNADLLHNLARTHREIKSYSQALLLVQRALKISVKALGPENPSIYSILMDMASIYICIKDYDQALASYQLALKIKEKAEGPGHPVIAVILDSMANLYSSALRNYERALPLFKRTLEIREKVFGLDNVHTISSLNNLAMCYEAVKEYDQALPLYQRALTTSEKILGPDHKGTADCLINLALHHWDVGSYSQSMSFLWRFIKILSKRVRIHIKQRLRRLIQGAFKLRPYRRPLGIREKVLEPEHSDTATSLYNRAELLYSKGDCEGAAPLYRRALGIREKVLGPEHPNTVAIAASLLSLALLFRDRGDHQKASEAYRQLLATYEGIEEKQGARIPEISSNMAMCHNELAFHTDVPAKNWKEAESHYRQAIDLFTCAAKPIEAANVELNLQTLFRLSGQPVDIDRVKELTGILEQAGDKRAEKGYKLLKEMP